MRQVFCKADDPKAIIPSFEKKLRDKYKIPANKIKVDLEKNDIECGYYHIHFCMEREWQILSTTRPGSGYLTIPFNRLLLSKNGVKPEECKLNNLFSLIVDSCNSDEVTEEEIVPDEVADEDNESAEEPNKKVQFKL